MHLTLDSCKCARYLPTVALVGSLTGTQGNTAPPWGNPCSSWYLFLETFTPQGAQFSGKHSYHHNKMAEGGADFGRAGFMVIAASAGAGALATVAGYYLIDKVRNAFATRPKMKLFHKHPFLSARCTWFISGGCISICILLINSLCPTCYRQIINKV